MHPHGLMFHHFHGPGHAPGQGSISADDLRRMIEWIGPQRLLHADEFLNRALTNRLRPNDCCITFDDNLRCQYDIALPVLREFNLTAFWFIYTGPLDGRLDKLEIYRSFRMRQFISVRHFYEAFDQIIFFQPHIREKLKEFDPNKYLAEFPFYTEEDRRFRFIRDEILGPAAYHEAMDEMIRVHQFDVEECAKWLWMNAEMIGELHETGHVIGLHSHSHPTRLERLSEDEQRAEYRTNFDRISSITKSPPRAMSHPCNSYNDATLRILQSLGIQLGFRANMAKPTLRNFEWPREDHANLIRRMAA